MSKEEMGTLKNSVGEDISTSVNRRKARSFLHTANPSDDAEQVFFEIDADPRLDNIKSFANITPLSYFLNKEEVLFMIGSFDLLR